MATEALLSPGVGISSCSLVNPSLRQTHLWSPCPHANKNRRSQGGIGGTRKRGYKPEPLGRTLRACHLKRMPSCFSHVRLFANPWIVTRQAPLFKGFSRREYWSGLPCPPPGYLPDPGIEPASLTPPALAGELFTTGATWEALSVQTHS